MKKAVVITGVLGGIGSELKKVFEESSFTVIGIDKRQVEDGNPFHLHDDIISCSDHGESSTRLLSRIERILDEYELELHGLINNAAVQILKPTESLQIEDWLETLKVNLLAPFFLSKGLLKRLENVHGAIVNISSIHERLTKPDFVAYATSKAALSGLTRAMAVDLGPRVRLNAICPAAIETAMLKAGFAGNPTGYQTLKDIHPVGRIGTPREVARLCVYLVNEGPGFLTGTTIGVDGGIAGRLHDPA
jgi:NAD(P)-dependent dehydrogenase (short-subunit alcohol dehydrogenase family)